MTGTRAYLPFTHSRLNDSHTNTRLPYLECGTARWCRSPLCWWPCPLARSRSQFPPSRQSPGTPRRWQLGTTSGAFKKQKLSQREDEQPGGGTRLDVSSTSFLLIQQLYLCDDEPTGHPQPGFGTKVAGDHDAEAGFRKPELGGAGVHDLVHHHHRSAAVGLSGLN